MQLSSFPIHDTNTRVKLKEGLAAAPGLWLTCRSERRGKLESANHPFSLSVPTTELLALGRKVLAILCRTNEPVWTREAKILEPQMLEGKASTLQFSNRENIWAG